MIKYYILIKGRTLFSAAIALLFITITLSCSQQKIDDQFFKTLKTEKVTSDPAIEWKNFGPGMSGFCREFWCHPTDSNVMFMGPDMHVSYGSWDNGKTWKTLKDSDGLAQDMKRVLDIDFSLQNPDFGMAIDWNGWTYETTDRGRSWKKTNELGQSYKDLGADPFSDDVFSKGWFPEQLGTRHSELAVDPTNDNIWYIGAGDFWNVKSNYRSFKEPYGNTLKYAAYGYIFKSNNKGKTWEKITTGLPKNTAVCKIIVNPNQTNQVVMAANVGLLLSNDGGLTWQNTAKGLPNNLPRDLTSFYDKETKAFTLYLAEQTVFEPNGKSINTKGGVYKSIDAGLNWVNITGDLGLDYNQIKDKEHRKNYHRALSHWFGADSKKLYPSFPANTYPVFNHIRVNPMNKNEIYLVANQRHDKSFGPGDVWKTIDGGKHWTICARAGKYWVNQTDKAYWERKGFKTEANVGFAHLQRKINEESETHFGNRFLAINAKGDVFIQINQQTQRSNDGGTSWQQIDDNETAPGSNKWIGRGGSNLPGRYMLLETGIKNRYLFCSGEHGLWQTANLGDWPNKNDVAMEQLEGQSYDHGGYHSAHSIATVAVHPNNPDIIYMLPWRQEHMGKVRRSLDSGKTWENIATIFKRKKGIWYMENPVAYQNSLMFDPKNPDIMYFCATRKSVQEIHGSIPEEAFEKGEYGVYKSTDMGFTWSAMNSGLPPNGSVRRLTMNPHNTKVLYASINQKNKSEPGGLYKSIDGAKNWSQVTNIPSEIQSVNNCFIDRNTKDIYISCGSRFGSYDAGGVWKSNDNGISWVKIFKAPYVWQTEVSPVNSEIIMVNAPIQLPEMWNQFKNPGIYLTKNAGASWFKINKGLGQQDKMTDIKPDPYNENILWSASWGSGWFKTIIK